MNDYSIKYSHGQRSYTQKYYDSQGQGHSTPPFYDNSNNRPQYKSYSYKKPYIAGGYMQNHQSSAPYMQQYCNNCGKYGHLFHQCKLPITSFGVVCYRKTRDNWGYENIEYLMIRRKDTLGLVDFIRGKYSVYNKEYIINMLKQMTVKEKEMLCTSDFAQIWKHVWGSDCGGSENEQHLHEEHVSCDKFNNLREGVFANGEFYTLYDLVEESYKYGKWEEPEWGFPKGRRNNLEKDFDCAVREFCEETGYSADKLVLIKNIVPYEEIFTGSNYKSYKHKYYVMNLKNENLSANANATEPKKFQETEVGECQWKTYDECIACIRPYNLEKLRLLKNVHTMLHI